MVLKASVHDKTEGLSEPKARHHFSFKNLHGDFFFLSPLRTVPSPAHLNPHSFSHSFSGQILKQSLATEKGNKS